VGGKLDAQITDKDANEYFLRLAKLWLADLERLDAPMMLMVIGETLQNAQNAVDKYAGWFHLSDYRLGGVDTTGCQVPCSQSGLVICRVDLSMRYGCPKKEKEPPVAEQLLTSDPYA